VLLLFGPYVAHLAGVSDTGQADDQDVECRAFMASSGPCPLFSLDLAETA
jgi:hypothetical protein